VAEGDKNKLYVLSKDPAAPYNLKELGFKEKDIPKAAASYSISCNQDGFDLLIGPR
jgi:hypothetical protein